MQSFIDQLKSHIANGKRLRDKYPECKFLENLEELERELHSLLEKGVIK